MNKEIKGLLIEIIILSFIIVINVIFWPNLREEHLKKTEAMMGYISNLSIDIISDEENYLLPMSDEYAINNLKRNIIEIKNYDNNFKNYTLYLRIDKDYTIDIKKVNFMFNNKIINLENTYFHENNNYVYYNVYNGNIKDKEYIKYICWLKKDSVINSNNFNYSFEVM